MNPSKISARAVAAEMRFQAALFSFRAAVANNCAGHAPGQIEQARAAVHDSLDAHLDAISHQIQAILSGKGS